MQTTSQTSGNPTLADNPEVQKLALRHVWWKTPKQALENQDEFLAQILNRAPLEDLQITTKYFSTENLKHALLNHPPGTINERSWHFWNIVLLNTPVNEIPELPKRKFYDDATH